MCGIIGVHFKNPRDMGISHDQLEVLVDQMLLGIEHRGRDATGLLVVDRKNTPFLEKVNVDAKTFVQFRTGLPKRVRTILGHTRFATQGVPEMNENNHPVQYGSCYAIHNGHIGNDTELFLNNDLERFAEVDSEIIPALFNKHGLDKAHLALQELDGGFATAVVDPERFPGVTVLAKGWASPVEYIETKYALVWASTATALQDACFAAMGFRPKLKRIQSLGVGEMLYADGDTIEKLTFKPKVKTYSRSSSYTYQWGSTYVSSGVPSQKEMYKECKSCSHARVHHGSGTDYDGACHLVENEFLCRCISFVRPVEERTPQGVEFCDDCGKEALIGQLVKSGNNGYYCKPCLVVDEGPTASELRGRAEAVLERMNAVAAEFNVEAWSDVVEAVKDEELWAHCCQMASTKTAMSAAFIDWLLAKAPKELMETDQTGYLGKCYDQAKGAFDRADEDLRWEVIDLEVAQYTDQTCEPIGEDVETGQVYVADATGQVVSLEEWRETQAEAEEAVMEEVIA